MKWLLLQWQRRWHNWKLEDGNMAFFGKGGGGVLWQLSPHIISQHIITVTFLLLIPISTGVIIYEQVSVILWYSELTLVLSSSFRLKWRHLIIEKWLGTLMFYYNPISLIIVMVLRPPIFIYTIYKYIMYTYAHICTTRYILFQLVVLHTCENDHISQWIWVNINVTFCFNET